jgi:hypothetical protein
MLKKLDKWHKTRLGLLVFALIELAIAYGFFSLSIDRGNFFWYLLTLIFLVGFLQNFFKLIGTFGRGKK